MSDNTSETYQLFQTETCPFCYRVRLFMDERGIDVPSRDISRDAQAYQELVQGGGRQTVPCLRIARPDGVEWMYESVDIMRYLAEKAA